jgi:hypothetical protein
MEKKLPYIVTVYEVDEDNHEVIMEKLDVGEGIDAMDEWYMMSMEVMGKELWEADDKREFLEEMSVKLKNNPKWSKIHEDVKNIIYNLEELGVRNPDMVYENFGTDSNGRLKMFDW